MRMSKLEGSRDLGEHIVNIVKARPVVVEAKPISAGSETVKTSVADAIKETTAKAHNDDGGATPGRGEAGSSS